MAREVEHAADYAAMEHAADDCANIQPTRRSPLARRILTAVVACAAITLSLFISSSSSFTTELLVQPWTSLRKGAAIPHTGSWCLGAGAKMYTKTTLKRIADRAIYGMLTYASTVGESKFEASDVTRVGETFYVVCDSSWSILKLDERLPMLSSANKLVDLVPSDVFTPPDEEDSGFEAIMHDASSGAANDFYLVRESIEHEKAAGGTAFEAEILKAHFGDDGSRQYTVEEVCHSEFRFEGDSKGFEGAVSLRGADGVLYILGLCEGNFCSEARGKEVGNGRVVVMKRADDESAPGGCVWKTVTTLELPKSVQFVDYSAIAVHHSTSAVAVTSQENSQLWVGELSGGYDGAFDPASAAFSEGTIYDFPRSSVGCEVQYCNIEGVHWVSGGKVDDGSTGAPQTLVAVSDKMKSKGRQPATCQEKDQSVHLFQLP